MADFLQSIVSSRLFLNLLNRSFAAGILVLAVLVLRLLLKKAPKWTHCVLWAFVALRLMLPLGIVSPLSVFGALQSQPNGSVEYFHAGGGSEKPLVEFDTVRIEAPEDPDDTLVQIPNGLAVTRHRASRYLPPLEAIWLAGLAGMALYALVSLLRLRRRVAASVPLGDGVFACDGIDAPFILGLFRPRIYLPADLGEPQSSHVLAHERAHLARRDHWWKPLGFALLAVYWFHPLLWLAYILFCRDIELACDERVLRALDEPARLDYSQSLLDLSRPRAALACPLAFGETGVRERIKAALHYKKPAFWIVAAAVAVCVLAAVCFLTNPAYSTKVSPEEEQMLRQMMSAHGYSTRDLQTDVLYNRSGNAWCLLAKNDEMYMIVRRRGFRFSESGEGNPYEGYMDVPKFYPGPLAYWVRGKDARVDRPVGDNQFYDLRKEKTVGAVGLRAMRVPYPPSTQGEPTQEAAQPLTGPLLTIQCDDQSVEAYEQLRWREAGGVSVDGAPLIEQIRSARREIPMILSVGPLTAALHVDAYFAEEGVSVLDERLNWVIQPQEGAGIEDLRDLEPGMYYCVLAVRRDDDDGASCYNCVFRLEIPWPGGPLLTVSNGNQSAETRPVLHWDDSESANIDHVTIREYIRDNAEMLQTLKYSSGPILLHMSPERLCSAQRFWVFDSALEKQYPDDPKLSADLTLPQELPAGIYYCALEVRVTKVDGAVDYCCVFRLEIPAAEEPAVPEEFQELFGDFPSVPAGELRKEAVVVTDQYARLHNKRLWDDFYAKVHSGQPADVVLAFYLAGKEYADKPVFTSLRYDGSEFHMRRDSSRTGFGSEFYESETYRYLLVFDREQRVSVMLSDELYDDADALYDDADALKEAIEAAHEDPVGSMAWLEHPPIKVLFWKKDPVEGP